MCSGEHEAAFDAERASTSLHPKIYFGGGGGLQGPRQPPSTTFTSPVSGRFCRIRNKMMTAGQSAVTPHFFNHCSNFEGQLAASYFAAANHQRAALRRPATRDAHNHS